MRQGLWRGNDLKIASAILMGTTCFSGLKMHDLGRTDNYTHLMDKILQFDGLDRSTFATVDFCVITINIF